MQRLTDIWTNLVGGSSSNLDAAQRDRERLDREERIREVFNNQYWTRIIAITQHRVEACE